MGPVELLQKILAAIEKLDRKGESAPRVTTGPSEAAKASAAAYRQKASQAMAAAAQARADAFAASYREGPRSPQARAARQVWRRNVAEAAQARAGLAAVKGQKAPAAQGGRRHANPLHAVGGALGAIGRYIPGAGEIGHGISTIGHFLDIFQQFRGMTGSPPTTAPATPAPPAPPGAPPAPPAPPKPPKPQPPGAPPAPAAPQSPTPPPAAPASGKTAVDALRAAMTSPARAAKYSPPPSIGTATLIQPGEPGKAPPAPARPPLEVLGAKTGQPYPGFHEIAPKPETAPAPGAPSETGGAEGSELRLRESIEKLIGKMAEINKGRQPGQSAASLPAGSPEMAAVQANAEALASAQKDSAAAEKYLEWAMKAAAVLIA
jgi:hypothetical protein